MCKNIKAKKHQEDSEKIGEKGGYVIGNRKVATFHQFVHSQM